MKNLLFALAILTSFASFASTNIEATFLYEAKSNAILTEQEILDKTYTKSSYRKMHVDGKFVRTKVFHLFGIFKVETPSFGSKLKISSVEPIEMNENGYEVTPLIKGTENCKMRLIYVASATRDGMIEIVIRSEFNKLEDRTSSSNLTICFIEMIEKSKGFVIPLKYNLEQKID